MILADEEVQWELTLQGDQFVVGGAALPEIEGDDAQTPREVFERRFQLITQMAATLDALFMTFLARRASGPWPHDRDAIKGWIKQRQQNPSAAIAAASRPRPEPAAVGN